MATNTHVIMHSITDIPLNALSIEELRLINEFTEWRRNQLAQQRTPRPDGVRWTNVDGLCKCLACLAKREVAMVPEAPKPQRRIRLDD